MWPINSGLTQVAVSFEQLAKCIQCEVFFFLTSEADQLWILRCPPIGEFVIDLNLFKKFLALDYYSLALGFLLYEVFVHMSRVTNFVGLSFGSL